MDNNFLANTLFSMLLKKNICPQDFKSQCEAIKTLLIDDTTGLIDVLTDFAVSSATVDFSIETDNPTFNNICKEYLDTLNIGLGTVPIGIKSLANQYFQERWKGSSFAVLQIAKWEKFEGTDLILPTQMFFVDGGSIHAEDVEERNNNLSIDSYNYFVGESKTPISSKSAIISRQGRWHEKYPTPYLIKRGIYHNAQIIQSLKSKQTEILEQIIPYLLLAKKGTEALTIQGKTYSQTQLQEIANQFQDLMTELKNTTIGDKQIKTPFRVTNFDEDLKHFIPDLSTIFAPVLFEQAERNILSGLGFIDVIQGISSTRRESTLNPKAFIQEVNAGVESFKDILRQLLVLIKYKNDTHIKYTNSEFYVCSSPIKAFMTEEFKTSIRSLYDRGCLSKRTYAELVGEVDFRTEVYRRIKEAKDGIDYVCYPPIIQNQEDKGIDLQGTAPDGTPQDINIPPDKQGIEKKNFNMSCDSGLIDDDIVNSSEEEIEIAKTFAPRITERYIRLRQRDPKDFEKDSFRTIVLSPSKGIKAIVGRPIGEKNTEIQSYIFLKEKKWTTKTAQEWMTEHSESFGTVVKRFDIVTAPYTQLTDLPSAVKKLSIDKQKAWRAIWNTAYRYMLSKTGNEKTAETYAFRVAWSQMKRIKSNLGFWESLKDKFTKK